MWDESIPQTCSLVSITKSLVQHHDSRAGYRCHEQAHEHQGADQPRQRRFCFSRNIGYVTPKNIYFHYERVLFTGSKYTGIYLLNFGYKITGVQAMGAMNKRMNIGALSKIMKDFEMQNARMEQTSEMMGDTLDEVFEVSHRRSVILFQPTERQASGEKYQLVPHKIILLGPMYRRTSTG